jgi:hypothetical protein
MIANVSGERFSVFRPALTSEATRKIAHALIAPFAKYAGSFYNFLVSV